MNRLSSKKLNDRPKVVSDEEFEALYGEYYDSFVLFGQKFIHDQTVVEDIVQEAFIKFWLRKNNFDNEYAIRAFLYKAVRNSCVNYLDHLRVRQKFSQEVAPFVYSEEYFSQHVIEEEVHRIINEAVQQLPESAREIYLMSLNGVKNNEIAEDLNISVNTVKTQKMRAKKILREKLKKINLILLCL
jgi:RNA polymerase sigma-70 factor (ECF subfamily)